MPLIFSNPDSPNGPIIPGGKGMRPGRGLDPSSLIESLGQQAKLKKGMWDKASTWEEPEMPELFEKGMPIDIGYLENEHYGALADIKEGIVKAGGNAQYYLGTDAGRKNLRRASLSQAQMALVVKEEQKYDRLAKRVDETGMGQDTWLSDNQNPYITKDGTAITVNEMMEAYLTDPAFSPFYGGKRVHGQNFTSFDEARKEIETYFDNINIDSYGGNKLGLQEMPGLGQVYQEVVQKGFSNVANIKRVLQGNGGLVNNLSDNVYAGLARGFDNQVGNYKEKEYIDEEGNFTEKYALEKQDWMFREIARIANEEKMDGHEKYTNIKKVPGGGGEDGEQGFNKWDSFVENRVSPGKNVDPVSQTYIASKSDGSFTRHTTPKTLARVNMADNAMQKQHSQFVTRMTSSAKSTGTSETLPTLGQMGLNDQYFYVKDHKGTNMVIDLSNSGQTTAHGLTNKDIIVWAVGTQGEEQVKPGARRVSATDSRLKRSILTERDDGSIDMTQLSNQIGSDPDGNKTTTMTLEMDLLVPLAAFNKFHAYDEDNRDGEVRFKKNIADEGTWYGADDEVKTQFKGYGNVKTEHETLGAGDEETKITEYNGNNYVRLKTQVPVNSSMAGIGSTEKYQTGMQSRYEAGFEIGTKIEKTNAQTTMDALNQQYENEIKRIKSEQGK